MAGDSTLPDLAGAQAVGRERMQELARAAIASGDPLAWYEQLYADADDGLTDVPWDHGQPTPFLVDWVEQRFPGGRARGRAVVVGCALGYDAELAAEHGFNTTAFDISATPSRPHGTATPTHRSTINGPTSWTCQRNGSADSIW